MRGASLRRPLIWAIHLTAYAYQGEILNLSPNLAGLAVVQHIKYDMIWFAALNAAHWADRQDFC